MRLGADVKPAVKGPEGWIAALQERGYRAAIWPLGGDAADDVTDAYVAAAAEADIVIAEVGAWCNNPLSSDDATRRQGIAHCQLRLAQADRIGARCCVNIAGSRGNNWAGHHPDDLTDDTFDLLVETIREIIDAVDPKRTAYTVEPMPWMFPDSPDSYLRLIQAVDRNAFAAHLDPVNIVNSPSRYYRNTDLINECFDKLGPYIKSCHAKDTIMTEQLTTHISECIPGDGALDYRTYLRRLEELDPDMPLLVEHFPEEGLRKGAEYLRSLARDMGIQA